jgi:glucan 1,3-beta-glucosidase
MWDALWRIGGTAETQLEMPGCVKDPGTPIFNPDPSCFASFLLLHITVTASLYMENNWGWVADHELDVLPHDQINI